MHQKVQNESFTRLNFTYFAKNIFSRHLNHCLLFKENSLKRQSYEIFDLQFFSSFKPAWTTDQWVKIFSFWVSFLPRYQNFSDLHYKVKGKKRFSTVFSKTDALVTSSKLALFSQFWKNEFIISHFVRLVPVQKF